MGNIAYRINLFLRFLEVRIWPDISHCQKPSGLRRSEFIYLFPFYRVNIVSLIPKTLQSFCSIRRNRNTETGFRIRVRCFENLSRLIIEENVLSKQNIPQLHVPVDGERQKPRALRVLHQQQRL